MFVKKSEAHVVSMGNSNIWAIGRGAHERKILGNLRKMLFMLKRKWKSFIIEIRYVHLSPIISVPSLNLIFWIPDSITRLRILWVMVLKHQNLLHLLMLSSHFHQNF